MLNEKIALVTGGGSGIGSAVAKKLAEQGAYVVVNYMHSEAGAKAVVAEIKQAGGQAECVQCSVNDFAAVEAMIKDIVKRHGRIDILVNNAGITKDNLLMKMKEEEFDAVIDTNLKGSFNTMRHIARYMLKQKSGSIVNISSVSGILGNPGQMNYCASKAGVIGMTKSMARELASRGIRVNAVAPGFIETEMLDQMTDAAKEAGKAQIPFGRYGKTEEIANTVAFLASEKASYITGQVICVDGGMAM